jgi:hypothetical protein
MMLVATLRLSTTFFGLALASGCGHQDASGLPAQVVEAAYVEGRAARTVCRRGDAMCCAEQSNAARADADRGNSVRAAHLWQEVALACPDRRTEARAALAGPSASVVARPSRPDTTPHVLNVSYRTRLSPAFRLFWVAAAVGPRLLPTAEPAEGSAPGPPSSAQAVQVEVHAIRFTGTRPGPLLVVERRLDLAFEPAAEIIVEIAEAPAGAASPLEVTAHVDKVRLTRGRDAQAPPPRPVPPPRLEKAQTIRMALPRTPLELGGPPPGPGRALRMCLDRDGQLDTIRFLEPLHPRFAASLIDMFRDSRHEPYRVNDLAVPSCQVLRP